MTNEQQDAYERGVREGEAKAQLADHGARLDAHDKVLAKMADTENELASAVRSLTEARAADAKTRIDTAAALAAADEQRRNQSKVTWTPFQRLLAVLAVLLTAALVILEAMH